MHSARQPSQCHRLIGSSRTARNRLTALGAAAPCRGAPPAFLFALFLAGSAFGGFARCARDQVDVLLVPQFPRTPRPPRPLALP
jgi:hypothetical protein